MSDDISKRVADRFLKEAMATLIRGLDGHDWGFWSNEEGRFHIQTVEPGAETGPKAVKFFLEDRGVRTIELAYGKANLAKVKARILADWPVLEEKWITLMVHRGWVRASLNDGDKIIVEAYPGTSGSFTRTLDLRQILAGLFDPGMTGTRPIEPKDVTINVELDAVEIWPHLPEADRHQFPLVNFLFTGRPT